MLARGGPAGQKERQVTGVVGADKERKEEADVDSVPQGRVIVLQGSRVRHLNSNFFIGIRSVGRVCVSQGQGWIRQLRGSTCAWVMMGPNFMLFSALGRILFARSGVRSRIIGFDRLNIRFGKRWDSCGMQCLTRREHF